MQFGAVIFPGAGVRAGLIQDYLGSAVAPLILSREIAHIHYNLYAMVSLKPLQDHFHSSQDPFRSPERQQEQMQRCGMSL